MTSFEIYCDTTEESIEEKQILSTVFKQPKLQSSKEPRSRRLQDSGQKQPNNRFRESSSQSTSGKSGSSISSSAGTSKSPFARTCSTSFASNDDHAQRNLRVLKKVEAILRAHPEEFSTIPEMGQEPNFQEEAEHWFYPPEIAALHYDCTFEKEPAEYRNFREVTNLGKHPWHVGYMLPPSPKRVSISPVLDDEDDLEMDIVSANDS